LYPSSLINGVNWLTKWPLICRPRRAAEPLPGLPRRGHHDYRAHFGSFASFLRGPLRVRFTPVNRHGLRGRYAPVSMTDLKVSVTASIGTQECNGMPPLKFWPTIIGASAGSRGIWLPPFRRSVEPDRGNPPQR
jgi:hypothetical protein